MTIRNEHNDLIKKVLRMYLSLYPTIDWDTFKAQVLEERQIFNPTKRFGLIWFHIPSVLCAVRAINFDEYSWLNIQNTFFRNEMHNKHVTFSKIKTIAIKGIKETDLLEENKDERAAN